MLRKTLTILVAVAMIAALAVTASARETVELSTADGDAVSAYAIDVSDLAEGSSWTLTFTVKDTGGTNGYRVRLSTDTIDAFTYDGFNDGAGADCPPDGKLPALIQESSGTFTVNFTVEGDYWKNTNTIAIVGWQGAHSFEVSNVSLTAAGGGAADDSAPADDGAANDSAEDDSAPADDGAANDSAADNSSANDGAGSNSTATVGTNSAVAVKDGADTGAASAAVLGGLSILAAGAIALSRKRK